MGSMDVNTSVNKSTQYDYLLSDDDNIKCNVEVYPSASDTDSI